MKNTMEYKGYTGSVEYSDEDGIFFGRVQFIRTSISYEGSNAEELRKNFHDGVEDYIATCKEKTSYRSSHSKDHSMCGLVVTCTVKLHSKRRGVSLNSLIIAAIEKETHHAT